LLRRGDGRGGLSGIEENESGSLMKRLLSKISCLYCNASLSIVVVGVFALQAFAVVPIDSTTRVIAVSGTTAPGGGGSLQRHRSTIRDRLPSSRILA
jgi:hypothetical protein